MDFEPQAHTEYKELAQKLLKLIPQVFPKKKKKRPDRDSPVQAKIRWINSRLL